MTYLATVTGLFLIDQKIQQKSNNKHNKNTRRWSWTNQNKKLTFFRCHIQKPCPHKTGFAVTQCQTSAISFCQQQKKETHKKTNVITRSYMYYL